MNEYTNIATFPLDSIKRRQAGNGLYRFKRVSLGAFGLIAMMCSAAAAGLTSDDFSGVGWKADTWTFIDPLGDASATVSGRALRIAVPGGASHDVWTDGNMAPRLMQAVENLDFEMEVKFESAPQERYQMQGLIVEQDAENFLRFEIHSDGAQTKLFAAGFGEGGPTVHLFQPVSLASGCFLRVHRASAQWTFSYSLDGQSWNVVAAFNRSMQVGSVGIFAGNAGASPPFTAVADYFFNTANPIVPEDGFKVAVDVAGRGMVIRNPSQETYLAGQEVELTAVAEVGWAFAGWGGGGFGYANPLSLTVSDNHSLVATFTNLPSAPGSVVSDDFSGVGWKPDTWTFIDPLGDASATVSGRALRIAVPGGASHDVWTDGNMAPRLMQAVENLDFEMEVKFESAPQERYQMQGLIVEQDAENFLRFEIHSDGAQTKLFAAGFGEGGPTVHLFQPVSLASGCFLRVHRASAQWTFSYSLDGQSWNVVAAFNRSMQVGSVGIFAGNAGASPPFTAVADYFFNTANPIVPEDGVTLAVNVMGQGTVLRDPARSAYDPGQTVQLSAVADANWAFAGWSGACTSASNPISLTLSQSLTLIATFTNLPALSTPPPLIISDDFGTGVLDTGLWTFVNPLGDAQATVSGRVLAIAVPSGVGHDVWIGANNAPRIMQRVNDGDFEVEAKFQSAPRECYQMEGLLVEQDAGNFLRFDVYWDGTGPRLFAADFSGGQPVVHANQVIGSGAAYWLRVKRTGGQWICSYSLDGQVWNVGVAFNRELAVANIGVFAGNAGDNPGFTALVDYVFNTAAPIVPEDGGALTVSAGSAGEGFVVRNPEQPTYAAGQEVELTAVPATNWTFAGWTGLGDPMANPLTVSLDRDVEVRARFIPTNAAAIIDVWYGDYQVFGREGLPQRWFNILGRILLPAEVSLLGYELNGQFQESLTFRAGSSHRLARDGDFNVELDSIALEPGTNQVTIVAVLRDGSQLRRNVIVVYAPQNEELAGCSISWSSAGNINAVAQVVDGRWTIEADGVRIQDPHYDRLIAVGRVSWTDYEATVPITVHGVVPTFPGYVPAVGLLARWQGHYELNGERPRIGWNPLGAIGWITWSDSTASGASLLQVFENDGTRTTTIPKSIAFGTRYLVKMRVETVPQPAAIKAVYRLKVWAEGLAEPVGWDIVHGATEGLESGSVALVSHFVDATFGEVTVVPVSNP